MESMDPVIQELRLFLGERINSLDTEETTLFTDEELGFIISRAAGKFYRMLALGWAAKAGLLADLIDANEDGSIRNLSQAWEHANKQAAMFAKKADTEDEVEIDDAMVALRAGPLGFDAFPCAEDDHTISLFSTDDANDIRMYPLLRFRAVKG
jgi:hypothetical protein